MELARNYLVNADHSRTRLGFYAFITISIALMNLNPSQIENLKTSLSIVQFIGADLLVELSNSLFATYLVYLGGPILSIVYLGIQESFYWFSPFLPNLNWITQAFIGILLPIFSMMIFHFGYSKEIRDSKAGSGEDANPLGWIAVTAISILIIWFAIGVFPIRPYVILTGSMEPLINPGDIVLVRRIDADDNVQVGDVIEYKSGDIYIFHRIIEIVEEDEETKYRTKGDNNSAEDPELVEAENLKGRLLCVIPKIGYPALIFHQK
jgi:signal peptidase